MPNTQPRKLLTKGPKNAFVIHQHCPAQAMLGGAKGQILVKPWSKKMLSAWSNISGSIDEAGRAACPPRVNIRAGADPLIDWYMANIWSRLLPAWTRAPYAQRTRRVLSLFFLRPTIMFVPSKHLCNIWSNASEYGEHQFRHLQSSSVFFPCLYLTMYNLHIPLYNRPLQFWSEYAFL